MNYGFSRRQDGTEEQAASPVSAPVNPEMPVVVSASTDLGYVAYLMSRSAPHRSWSAERIMALALPALASRQIRVYCDDKGAPMGVVIWAFVDRSGEAALREGRMPGEASAFRSGDRLWILQFIAPFGGARSMIRELRSNVFPPGQSGHWIRYAQDGSIRRIARWRGGAAEPAPRRSPEALIREAWGDTQRIGYFAEDADTLAEAIGRGHDRLAALLAPKPGDRVLELGCGLGAAARRLARRHDCEVVGIDERAWRVNRAFEIMGVFPSVTYRRASLEDLPEESESFDRAFAAESLGGVHDLDRALAECNRVLKPGGRLVVSDVAAALEAPPDDLRTASGALNLLPTTGWRSALRRAGFEVVATEDWSAHQARTYELLKESLLRRQAGKESVSRAVQDLDRRREASEAGRLGHVVLLAEKRRAAKRPQRDRAGRRISTLVMLSGGIDSVYALWRILTETDDEVLAHHINFVNSERRHVVEAQRCRKIVDYLRRRVRDFEYTESTLDHRSYAFFGYDMIAVGFEAGLAAQSYLFRKSRPVDRWTVGVCVEEGISMQGRWPHVVACCAANSYPHEAPAYLELPEVTKREEIDGLPKDLLELTWGCRRPVASESGYQACGVCKTCRLLESIAERD